LKNTPTEKELPFE
jgi:hypothetical protein